MKKNIFSTILCVLSLAFFGTSLIFFSLVATTKVRTITEIDKDVTYSMIENENSKVYNEASKSCVGIYSTIGNKSSSGSGVVYKKVDDTYFVVTNYHVIDGCSSTNIYFDGEYEKANLIGGDSKNDIAVLSFKFSANNKTKDNIKVCDFLNYSTIKVPNVGERALIIGCPIGIENYNTLTVGVISQVTNLDIITDASVNVGNSGGGMFNANGELIGIIYKKERATSNGTLIEGRASAIPLDVVKNSIRNIEKENKVISLASLPFSLVCINRVINQTSKYYEYMPEDDKNYHLIVSNIDDSIKCGSKIKYGDCLLKINDTEVSNVNDVNYFLRTTLSGENATLTLYREATGVFNVSITL